MSRTRKRVPTVEVNTDPVVVDVRSLSNFAFAAGLTLSGAEGLLVDFPDEDCRVVLRRCPACSPYEVVRILVALRAHCDRDVLYCENCGEADIWV
jgi:hypothetical protein